MSSDVPLSDLGRQNADALRVKLANEKIEQVYSTNYARTRSTVQPIADQLNLKVQTYNPTDTVFFRQLRESKKNVLIAGHSNTVDDLVNYLLGYRKMNDLPDDQYEDLFIIRKKGKTFSLEVKKWKD